MGKLVERSPLGEAWEGELRAKAPRGRMGALIRTWGSGALLGFLALGCNAEDKNSVPPLGSKTLRQSFAADNVAANVTERGGARRVRGPALAQGATPRESARRFVSERAEALGVAPGDLKEVAAGGGSSGPLGLMYDRKTKTYKYWLYRYEQEHGGLPVHDGKLLTLVRNGGNHPVVWAHAGTKKLGGFTPKARARAPQLDSSKVARALSTQEDFKGRPLGAKVQVGPGRNSQAVIYAPETAAAPRLAYSFDVTTTSPDGQWSVIVDADSGDVLETRSTVVFENITGQAEGLATQGHRAMDCAEEVAQALPHSSVEVAGGNGATVGLDGSFVIDHDGDTPVDVTSSLSGTFFRVVDYDGASTSLTQTVTPPGPVDFLHNPGNLTDADRARVNGYVESHLVRDFLLTYLPDYPTIATQLDFPVYVNRTDLYCPGNAWYDGSSINFCVGSSTYGNTSFGDVNYHEYGHHIVEMGGSGQGAYGEGMADVVSVLLSGTPGMGHGFYLDACDDPLRTADNTCQYSASSCSSCGSGSHACGNLLSGIIWDIREELEITEPQDYQDIINSLALSSIPMHTGTSIDVSIAEDLLVLDDDDGNLANGTPHGQEICTGFALHGIDCPLPDTGLSVSEPAFEAEGPSGGPFEPSQFDYELFNIGPGAIDYSVSIEDASWLSIVSGGAGTLAEGEEVQLSVTIDQAVAAGLGNGDYTATIVFDNLTNGEGSTERTLRLRVGIPQAVYTEDFEQGLGGFTIGNESNNLWRLASDCSAATGAHSTPNALYFGNTSCNFDSGTVAGTVVSPSVALTDTSLVLLEYNYLLENEGGATYDRAAIEVSVNGGAYQVVASSYGLGDELQDTATWTNQELDVSALFDGSPAQMQLRLSFDSRDSVYNDYEGFLFDDVTVRAFSEGCVSDADCQDALSCNGNETCQGGVCVSGTPVSCDDSVACTVDQCDEAEGCEHTPDDSSCDDGDVCNGAETCDELSGCSAGTPLSCDDGDACTVDSCDSAAGCANEPVDCDDGDACTVEACDPILGCSSEPIDCDDGNPCTVDSCDAVLGCVSEPLSCDDGDACTTDSCDAGVCVYEDNGSCTADPVFQEQGGTVVFEAENYLESIDRSSHTWVENSSSGASSGALLLASPNTGALLNTGYVTTSPELTYDVNFTTTGTYYVWVRGIGASQDDDSCHVGIDGVGPASSDRISSFSTQLSWSRSTMDGSFATIVVSTPGIHTISVWMREDGFQLDKLVLTTDSGFTPTGLGPDESPTTQEPEEDECVVDSDCDDGNACTDTACVAGQCTTSFNTDPCTDDQDSCTDDICESGQCTHPDNGTCQSQGPCAAYCSDPVVFPGGNYNSGNLGSNATCHETTGNINSGVCGNMQSGRTLSINGVQMSCNGAPWSLPPAEDGGYCVTTTSGGFDWAYFVTW